jgi:hypothetical protein
VLLYYIGIADASIAIASAVASSVPLKNVEQQCPAAAVLNPLRSELEVKPGWQGVHWAVAVRKAKAARRGASERLWNGLVNDIHTARKAKAPVSEIILKDLKKPNTSNWTSCCRGQYRRSSTPV